ncbi:MAG: histidine kinase dimerization/phospho-acceptor domain-containing protein, partial [Bacilli bacterium]
MRTLYTRIVVTIAIVVVTSFFGSFLLMNGYYHKVLKDENEAKIERMVASIQHFLNTTDLTKDEAMGYLQTVADLNYHVYLYDANQKPMVFGDELRDENLPTGTISNVLAGQQYKGISAFEDNVFVTGFFRSDLANTVGERLTIADEDYALFLRPNIKRQFEEMHVLFAVMFGLSFILSILIILVLSTHIVQPIRRLAEATTAVASGTFESDLQIHRRDEIGELARNFEQMVADLGEVDRMRQEFVANVSHEFRTPLTSIQGFARVLKENELEETERTNYANIIEEESARLGRMADQLLVLARLDAADGVISKRD